jgi:predicted methyltransferase
MHVAGPAPGPAPTAVAAYDGLATQWQKGAANVYGPLATALVAASPVPLRGRLVLDSGSGTGAVARAATASGALVVAAERSLTMLNHQHANRGPVWLPTCWTYRSRTALSTWRWPVS